MILYNPIFPNVADQTVVFLLLVEGEKFQSKNGSLLKLIWIVEATIYCMP